MIILRGVSGSGKSTWARNQSGVVIVSRDNIRVMEYGSDGPDYYNTVTKEILAERENTVSVIQDSMIEGLLRAGKDVVVDNTNIEWKFVKALAKIANREGAEVEIKVFDVPLATAIQRNQIRAHLGGRNVPETAIRKQHSRFQGNKGKELDPVFIPEPYNGTPGKPKAFLVDIDGTLAHMRDYRGPFDWKNVGLDDVDQTIADIANVLTGDGYSWSNGDRPQMIVMSGRDESCRRETTLWLNKHFIAWDHLFMRPEKDMRPDNIVKAELFDKHVRDNFDVKFVLDDRQQVVDMWRAMGLTCLQVAEGNF